jgi:hypothetical protein
MRRSALCGMCLCFALLVGSGTAYADFLLGSFNFNSSQFGNTLIESDGGKFSSNNFLNIINANPGNPGFLTGANVNTGIANIGSRPHVPTYTIGYATAISNNAGFDLGIVTAIFTSTATIASFSNGGDTATMAVSSNGGVTFSSPLNFPQALAQPTGVTMAYFYGSFGQMSASLFVTPVDLSNFGVPGGATINSVQITGSPALNLIRVAGLSPVEVPEPTSLLLLTTAVGALTAAAWRRRTKPSSHT